MEVKSGGLGCWEEKELLEGLPLGNGWRFLRAVSRGVSGCVEHPSGTLGVPVAPWGSVLV